MNIAARLEGVPGDYGCRIVVGPATAAAIADRFVLCELDWIKVKGKEEPLTIYELLAEPQSAEGQSANGAALAYAAQYRAALEHYRAGDFSAAEAGWRNGARHPYLSGAGPSPPLVMAERCAELRQAPPAGWDGVFVKTTK